MALFLPAAELQLARGESYRDTALVLSRFLSALMIRTFDQAEVEEFAEHASIPVINGLTDETHPLQALADAMTLRERFGDARRAPHRLRRRRQQRVPLAHAHRRAASGWSSSRRRPPGTSPTPSSSRQQPRTRARTAAASTLVTDPREAATRRARRSTRMSGRAWARTRSASSASASSSRTASTTSLLALADRDAVAMHCLPAHVGEEITADVLYGPRCLAWEQAENRLHTQKALMALVIR